MSHVHIRIHRWVMWWLCLGVVLGAVALVNILFRDLTHFQDKIILVVGAMHWVLGGLVCWAYDGIQVSSPPLARPREASRTAELGEWHAASDFVLPGGRKSLLPPWY